MADSDPILKDCAAVAALVGQGLLSDRGGNVSVRSTGGFRITASGRPKGALTPEDWVELRPAVASPAAERAASSEWRVHAALYDARPEVGAVVHGHAAAGLAWALGAARLPWVDTEAALLGEVRVLPWIQPGGDALADAVVAALTVADRPDAVLLRHHGFVAVGSNLAAAAAAARVLERSANVALAAAAAHQRVDELEDEVARRLRERYGGFCSSFGG